MEKAVELIKGDGEPWRVLEFYSGIGGMRYSILQAKVLATVLEAFDINEKANDVYQHNFGHRPYQGNIQSLTAVELDKFGAHAWLLSPPCQPYTRQGLQKDAQDARAASFLKILELIPQTLKPPFMLFVENVVGFETSETHKQMIEILVETGFVTQEFVLNPLQFGVPYSRPRYFCLAKRIPLAFRSSLFNHQLLWTPTPLLVHDDNKSTDEYLSDHMNERLKVSDLSSCKPIKKFLETETFSRSFSKNEESVSQKCACAPDGRKQSLPAMDLADNPDEKVEKVVSQDGSLNQYTVPLGLIERWGSAMDIVFPDSKRCCCFTKSYHRYVKGTGSFLATIQPEKNIEASSLKELGLRYFTPREVANLHSFPEDFDFPKHISLNQRNSKGRRSPCTTKKKIQSSLSKSTSSSLLQASRRRSKVCFAGEQS